MSHMPRSLQKVCLWRVFEHNKHQVSLNPFFSVITPRETKNRYGRSPALLFHHLIVPAYSWYALGLSDSNERPPRFCAEFKRKTVRVRCTKFPETTFGAVHKRKSQRALREMLISRYHFRVQMRTLTPFILIVFCNKNNAKQPIYKPRSAQGTCLIVFNTKRYQNPIRQTAGVSFVSLG